MYFLAQGYAALDLKRSDKKFYEQHRHKYKMDDAIFLEAKGHEGKIYNVS